MMCKTTSSQGASSLHVSSLSCRGSQPAHQIKMTGQPAWPGTLIYPQCMANTSPTSRCMTASLQLCIVSLLGWTADHRDHALCCRPALPAPQSPAAYRRPLTPDSSEGYVSRGRSVERDTAEPDWRSSVAGARSMYSDDAGPDDAGPDNGMMGDLFSE